MWVRMRARCLHQCDSERYICICMSKGVGAYAGSMMKTMVKAVLYCERYYLIVMRAMCKSFYEQRATAKASRSRHRGELHKQSRHKCVCEFVCCMCVCACKGVLCEKSFLTRERQRREADIGTQGNFTNNHVICVVSLCVACACAPVNACYV